MALKINTQAPDFTLPSTSGSDFTLSENMKGKPGIIYFYPKDFTPGCTQEACDFRDNIAYFKQFDIDVVGISRDTIETHQRFKKEHDLPFELLADKTGDVCKKYEALLPIVRVPKRVTYLLDKDHKIVATFDNLFGAKKHIQEMISKVKSELVEG